MYSIGHSRIIGSGIYEPEQVVRSEELMDEIQANEKFGLPTAWLERLTGVKERRCAPDDIMPSDMAASAARTAMDLAHTTAKEIDGIIYCGVIRDYALEPSTAHAVQSKIGAKRAFAFDISNACLGFVTAMQVMDSLIATKQVTKGLVVTGEKGFTFTKRALTELRAANDRAVFDDLFAGMTLGDAGAAVVMEKKKSVASGIVGFNSLSQGEYANLCYCGSTTEVGALHTDMTSIVGVSTTLGKSVFRGLLNDKLKWEITDIDRYIPHQVGKITFKIHSEELGVPLNKMSNSITHYGNLISATLPFNLHRLQCAQPIEEGEKIFMAGAGSGICAGHIGMIWDAPNTMH